jgi:hypothetical protein
MYKIIGANQTEYGPVSADQLRQWIAEGRVNAQTLIQMEGESGWKPLSEYPDFAGSLGSVPPPPPSFGNPPAFGAPPLDDAGRARALEQVNGPAIGLIVTASIGFLLGVLGIVLTLVGTSLRTINTGNPQLDQALRSINTGGSIVQTLIGLALSGSVFYGALKMKRLENYGLVLGVSILAMIPCIGPCCVVGLPIGIWALVVLNKPEVKSYFGR